MNLEVGQKLWCVNNSGGRADAGREVVVEKVGRKWAVLSNGYRMDIETGGLDGGQYKSPGRCYVSREAYEAELARPVNTRMRAGRAAVARIERSCLG